MHETATARDHVDVLIVGAGLSGIGTAWHLQQGQPGKSYAILEARGASGGTWDLFRYPGIRSDSDLSTFAYGFKPWTGAKAIADGPEILRYLRDTAADAGIDEHIRYEHRVVGAAWSSADALWTITAERADTGETVTLTAGWLFCASGYYRYDEGFTPGFPGIGDFDGQVIHPQHWPEDFDAEGKRVVVIGSGATAVTLVPALAKEGAQVTMLQRSPSYVMSLPERDVIADKLRAWFGDARGHQLTRKKNIWQQRKVYSFCQKHPKLARRLIRKLTEKQLPEHLDVDTHFNPSYDPWDQRLCAVPDGDLFRAFRKGQADVVTDKIDTFTPGGVRLASGKELEADVVVTATGLNLLLFGGMELEVDGTPVSIPDTMAFRGMMLSGVPNFAFAIGYTNSSWTLKVDLVCQHLNRILSHMDAHGLASAVPVHDATMEQRPLLDFSAGYVQRALDRMPKQGTGAPWHLAMDYAEDVAHLRAGPVTDPALRFGPKPVAGLADLELAA
ncbi:MAG: NAD(P)/FAD-dependent oxidoreductase [Solirubrobacterales bacterium]|jgi:monooxygenase|nr:NAD(P)/FAD-dependent oxidoreductase [Solirubrobacterales bacterium]